MGTAWVASMSTRLPCRAAAAVIAASGAAMPVCIWTRLVATRVVPSRMASGSSAMSHLADTHAALLGDEQRVQHRGELVLGHDHLVPGPERRGDHGHGHAHGGLEGDLRG